MSLDGDDASGMTATPPIHDDVIEAIVRGRSVHRVHEPLAAFAREVRALGDEPVPAPSAELTSLIRDGAPARGGAVAVVGVATRRNPSGRTGRRRTRGSPRIVGTTSRITGLGLAAKIGLGTSLAAAAVGSAGAAGILPAAADDAVRDAIEVVSPVEFNETRQRRGARLRRPGLR